MLKAVFSLILFTQGVFGLDEVVIPDGIVPIGHMEEARLRTIDFSQWFSDDDEHSNSEKIQNLFTIVECLTTNSARNCNILVNQSRHKFEDSKSKRRKPITKPRPVPPNTVMYPLQPGYYPIQPYPQPQPMPQPFPAPQPQPQPMPQPQPVIPQPMPVPQPQPQPIPAPQPQPQPVPQPQPQPSMTTSQPPVTTTAVPPATP